MLGCGRGRDCKWVEGWEWITKNLLYVYQIDGIGAVFASIPYFRG